MWKKIAGAVALIVLAVAGCGLGYLYIRKPAMAPPSPIHVEMTPERIARGKYLFQKVMDCDGCHSEHDESRFGSAGRGGGARQRIRFPGRTRAAGQDRRIQHYAGRRDRNRRLD